MGVKKDTAIALYIDGIRDGNARSAVTRHTGDRYTQHSTGVADGIEGFVAFFEPFIERNPIRDIQIIRGLEDGNHVFLQAYQSLNHGEAEWVTTDFFDTDDNDKIVEHWDVIGGFSGKLESGLTSVDGPTEVTDLDKTDANKALVRKLITDVLIPNSHAESLNSLLADNVVHHDPDLAGGGAAYAARVLGANRSLAYDELFLLVGEGNFVATLCRAYLDGVEFAHVDVYRLEGGRIVERWINAEPVPPKEEWTNSGKF